MVESRRPRPPAAGGRPRGRPRPPSSGGTTNPFAKLRMARRKKPKSQGYSLLLKDSVIYGAGRALQKFLVALLLPLYTAFLTPADYGILGMVVTVTTFLDVFVTLGFDVAFSRFYFDDKSAAGAPQGHHQRLLRLHRLPADPARHDRRAHAAARADPARQGVRPRRLALLRRRAGDAVLQQPQRPAVHAVPPRAQAVDLHRLHHRPHLRAGAALHRVRRRVRLGARWACCWPTSSPPPACRWACCRPTSARSTGAGTGS